MLGLKVPFDGELTCGASRLPDPRGRYKCGQVWGIPHRGRRGGPSTTRAAPTCSTTRYGTGAWTALLCGIAGRAYTRHFVPGSWPPWTPKLILAHHHHDFFRPVEGDMGFSLNVNLGAFADDVAAAAPGLPVRTLDPLQTVSAAPA